MAIGDDRVPSQRPISVAMAAAVLALGVACSNTTGPDGRPESSEAVRDDLFAFVDVALVPMDAEQVLPHRTVVVRHGVIEQVGPAEAVEVPEDATVIRGEGRWLMPGLVDMHVHVNSAEVDEYLHHGITTVRNMWGFLALPDILARIESGELAGPRIRSLSPGIDGPPVRWPQTQLLTDPARADSMVQAQLEQGYMTVKVYADLGLDVYDSVVVAVKRRGMEFAGHVPFAVDVEHALRSGQKSIEHLLGYRSRPRDEWEDLATLTIETGTWNCPTLAILRRAMPESASLRMELVRTLQERGAPIVVGTDSGIGVTRPGWSIHEELDLLVEAGLTPYEALLGATREAAHYFGEEEAWGRIRVGMRADLLLLAANPLDDVTATAAHEGVLRGDLWLPLTPH